MQYIVGRIGARLQPDVITNQLALQCKLVRMKHPHAEISGESIRMDICTHIPHSTPPAIGVRIPCGARK
jgi:hypothetical protein